MGLRLLQINPVVRKNTSTGRIMQEIGELALMHGWESYIAYSKGRDGKNHNCKSMELPIGNKLDILVHGIATRIFDSHGLHSSTSTFKLIRSIEQINPDIVHIHNLHGYYINYKLLIDYLSQSEIPTIWTIHDCWMFTGHCYYYTLAKCDRWKWGCYNCPQQKKFPASYLYDRSRQNFKDKKEAFTSFKKDKLTLVPVSKWMEKELRCSFMNKYPIKIITNGIDTDIFAPISHDQRELLKSKMGIKDKRIILGVANRFTAEKGILDFIELYKKLEYDEKIVLVGVDEKWRRSLPKDIIAIPTISDLAFLSSLYSIADVFANPTHQDNYPTVLLEAQACGTPVVTYDVGGCKESLSAGNGIAVEENPLSMLQAIRKMYSADEEQIRQYAIDNFSKSKCYESYFNLYHECLKNHI